MHLQIGQYISSNGGVVTAEELAPYLDLQTNEQTMVLYFFPSLSVIFLSEAVNGHYHFIAKNFWEAGFFLF